MKLKRVAITGLGIISPIGKTKEEFWHSIVNGKGGASKLTRFDSSYFTSHIAAEVKDFDAAAYGINPKELRRMDRFVQLAVCASKLA
ncbi:MAG: beta-ketoacyl synthase N-terminal-like domain-containing protein, partial [Candidatus Omnitrophica bacterium]|nr:beta-ketoacyl synthase N-terminal-like domain-containing protein [Candidatus Omnitrophota bacterium]